MTEESKTPAFDKWLAGLPLRCTRGPGGHGQGVGAMFQLTITVHKEGFGYFAYKAVPVEDAEIDALVRPDTAVGSFKDVMKSLERVWEKARHYAEDTCAPKRMASDEATQQ